MYVLYGNNVGMFRAATMYGITECTESKKKCTELYGMKIGVLSVQKYVRMYGILGKGIFKLKIYSTAGMFSFVQAYKLSLIILYSGLQYYHSILEGVGTRSRHDKHYIIVGGVEPQWLISCFNANFFVPQYFQTFHCYMF